MSRRSTAAKVDGTPWLKPGRAGRVRRSARLSLLGEFMNVNLLRLWPYVQKVTPLTAPAFAWVFLVTPSLVFQSGRQNRMPAFDTRECDIGTERIGSNLDAIRVHNEVICDLHLLRYLSCASAIRPSSTTQSRKGGRLGLRDAWMTIPPWRDRGSLQRIVRRHVLDSTEQGRDR